MVDCTGFENRQARKGLGGSNPSLSAITFEFPILHRFTQLASVRLTVSKAPLLISLNFLKWEIGK